MSCYSCDRTADPDAPPWERVFEDEHWRVAHAFNSSLRGWLVVLPKRHVEAIHELTGEEMDALGGIVHRLSVALREVTGCEKTYVMQFSEAAAHKHVHIHVVPRMADFTPEQIGPNVFTFLTSDGLGALGDREMSVVGEAIRTAMR